MRFGAGWNNPNNHHSSLTRRHVKWLIRSALDHGGALQYDDSNGRLYEALRRDEEAFTVTKGVHPGGGLHIKVTFSGDGDLPPETFHLDLIKRSMKYYVKGVRAYRPGHR